MASAAVAAAEPSSEPDAVTGPEAALQAGAEAVLPSLRALLEDDGILPQQVLGALNFVSMILNDVVAQLSDAENFAKFRRLKIAAVRKKAPHKPEKVEALLRAIGFVPVQSVAGSEPEHLEWGPDEAAALAPSLAALVLIQRIQARGESQEGRRALSAPVNTGIRVQDVLQLRYGREHLLEPRGKRTSMLGGTQKAGSSKGALVRPEWFQEKLPHLAPMLEETLADGARERAAVSAVLKTLIELRASTAKLVVAPLLRETAHAVAGLVLQSLRLPEMREEPTSPAEEAAKEMLRLQAKAAEPDGEPPVDGAVPSSTSTALAMPSEGAAHFATKPLHLKGIDAVERMLVPTLMECVPAFRLGIPYHAITEIIYLREAPAFFTAGPHDKAFEISLASLGEYLVNGMTRKGVPASKQLLSEEVTVVGIGCAVDISKDDKAVICVIVA